MENGTFRLGLVACIAGGLFPGKGEKRRFVGGVGIMAAVALLSHDRFVMPALFLFGMALKAQFREPFDQLVPEVRPVGIMTGRAALLHGGMDPGPRRLFLVAFLAGKHRLGWRRMRVVAVDAIKFIEGGVPDGRGEDVFVAGSALSRRNRF